MLNCIVIMGRLVRDPELRRTGSGIAVASFTVAVERDFAQNGQKETDYIDCVAWRQTGEFVSKYFAKGSMIALKGRLQGRDWNDKDGNKRRSWEIQVDNAYFGSSKNSQENGHSTYQGGGYGAGGYPETMAAAQRYMNSGGIPEPQYQQSDFAMLEDDDAKLPF